MATISPFFDWNSLLTGIGAKPQTQDDLYGYALYNLSLGKAANLPVSSNQLTGLQQTQLNKSLQVAKSTGDKKWQTIIEYGLTYGGQVLAILSATGVIKNKNFQSIIDGEIDETAYDELVSKGRTYSANYKEGEDPNNNKFKIFGVEITPINVIIIIVLLVILYRSFVKEGKKR